MSDTISGDGHVTANADAYPSSMIGGPLPQINDPVREDDIEDTIQAIVVGILRFPGSLVRPRWQVNDPNQPTADTDWCALGIVDRETQGYPYVRHERGGPSILYRWVTLTVLVSMYGPNATDNAERLRDALYINQSWDSLSLLNIRFIEAVGVTLVPDLVNTQWINRADLRIRFTMEQTRSYRILDIASSDGTITTDTGVTGSFLALDPGV